ncbi:hypothetical protein CYMTET_11355 [Cymbomonas tetramitiformis]|uniref:Uncharacterized protein n=1 Tax=Cymbomonas tetramitiformis TaxID=36881 RepID=A0AAE0GNV9_9CHLO|nr:hypothetical protein CYMTET_11355 [Cymbomonas tetramitiformis]
MDSKGAEELLEELAAAVESYQDKRYVESTKRSSGTGVRALLTFCVRSYLTCMRSLHLQQSVEWVPVAQRFWVAAALQGVRRTWDRPAKPAAVLMGFYGRFQHDNLIMGKAQAWNIRGAPVREDVLFMATWDMVDALRAYLMVTVDLADGVPVFKMEEEGKRGVLLPIKHPTLVTGLKGLAGQSDCYERYCERDDEQRLILLAALAEAAKELS